MPQLVVPEPVSLIAFLPFFKRYNNKPMKRILPKIPTINSIGNSYGAITTLPIISQTSTNSAPNKAVSTKVPRILSPVNMATTFGTIRPIYEIDPTTTTTDAVITAAMVSPINKIRL